jgi:outer membrane receptor protein involved in Fe transport
MIQAVATAAGDSTWENLGGAAVEGFEGAFSYDLGAWFDRSWEVRREVQAAWLTRYEDEVTGEDLLHVSDLHLAAALTVSNPGDFFVRVQASYWGPQRVEDRESGRFPVPVTEKGGFTVVNLSAGKTLARTERAGDLSVRLEVKNLLDHHYDHAKGYPMPGARLFGGLTWEF